MPGRSRTEVSPSTAEVRTKRKDRRVAQPHDQWQRRRRNVTVRSPDRAALSRYAWIVPRLVTGWERNVATVRDDEHRGGVGWVRSQSLLPTGPGSRGGSG